MDACPQWKSAEWNQRRALSEMRSFTFTISSAIRSYLHHSSPHRTHLDMTPVATSSAVAGPSFKPDASSSASTSSSSPTFKRRRPITKDDDDDVPKYSYDDDDADDYDSKRYIPLKQRSVQELQRFSRHSSAKASDERDGADGSGSSPHPPTERRRGGGGRDDSDGEGTNEDEDTLGKRQKTTTLLDEARALREAKTYATQTEAEKQAEEERKILEAHAARRKLASDMELAKGISYTEPLKTSWTAPHFVRSRTEEQNAKLREQHHVLADGMDIPPLITNFRVSMKHRLAKEDITLRLILSPLSF